MTGLVIINVADNSLELFVVSAHCMHRDRIHCKKSGNDRIVSTCLPLDDEDPKKFDYQV